MKNFSIDSRWTGWDRDRVWGEGCHKQHTWKICIQLYANQYFFSFNQNSERKQVEEASQKYICPYFKSFFHTTCKYFKELLVCGQSF